VQAEEPVVVEPVAADPPAEAAPQPPEAKSGRELSKANIKVIRAVADDLEELAGDDSLKRGQLALVERCHKALRELLDRVDEEDDGKGVKGEQPGEDPFVAARTLLACGDIALKRRAARALEAQIKTQTLDERGREFSRLLRR